MSPKRIGHHIAGGPEPDGERTKRERQGALKDAFSRWATGVTILAVRAQDAVHALTVSGFVPVSITPPLVLASLGPNASVLPYLEEGTWFAISVLTARQQRLSSRFADPFPVGPSPFPSEGPPIIEGALAALVCEVEELLERGDHTLVLAQVLRATEGPDEPPLLYYRRDYGSIG